MDSSDGNKKKKYIIDFYLIKNDNGHDQTNLKKIKIRDKQKLFVERWKIKYKENCSFNPKNKNNVLFLDKKMKIIEKNIITYSKILPLFNISKDKNNNYSIDFKFNTNKKNGNNLFADEKSTQKIKLIYDDFYSLKICIKYVNISPEKIELFFNKINNDFVIIPSNKSRKRFLSDADYDTNYKKSSQYLLNNIEQNDNDEEILSNNNNNKYQESSNNIENYHLNRNRGLSYEDKYIQKYINLKLNQEESEKKDNSSDDDLSLIIRETKSGTENGSDENKNNLRKMTYDCSNNNNTKDSNFKKSKTLKNPKSFKEENDYLNNFDYKDNIIKDIIQEYQRVKKMVKMMPNYDNIKYKKLSTYIYSS